MSRIRRVLFPTDLSFCSPALASTVRTMIERWNMEITLLHVLETRRLFGRGNDMESSMALLEYIARTEFSGARIIRRVARGGPADGILEYVRENHVDLIVMPARDTAAGIRRPLGHVTEEVLADAPCSVWLDWGNGVAAAPAGMRARRVCCAIDLNDSPEHVLGEAALSAAELGAALTLVHAVTPEPGRPASLWDAAVRERAVRHATMQIGALRRRFAPTAGMEVQVGDTGTVVSRVIRNLDAGLLVSGGSRESILAADSACPVLRLAAPRWSAVRAPVPEIWELAAKERCA